MNIELKIGTTLVSVDEKTGKRTPLQVVPYRGTKGRCSKCYFSCGAVCFNDCGLQCDSTAREDGKEVYFKKILTVNKTKQL